MKRLALLGATVAVLLGTAAPALADGPSAGGCGGGYAGGAVVAPDSYRATHWDSGAGTLGIDAPRGWSFVRTPTGEGRFHDPSGQGLLSLAAVTASGTPAAQLQARARALVGT